MSNKITGLLFDKMRRLTTDGVPEQEQEKIVEDIINIFKEHKLSYSNCFRLLDIIHDTLGVMSRNVHL